MKNVILPTILALTTIAAPVSATTYVGAISGQGSEWQDFYDANYNNFNPGFSGRYDVSFVIRTYSNYTSSKTGKFYSNFIESALTLTRPYSYYFPDSETLMLSSDNGEISFATNAFGSTFSFQGATADYYSTVINFSFVNVFGSKNEIVGYTALSSSAGIPIDEFVYQHFDEETGQYVDGVGANYASSIGFYPTTGAIFTAVPEPATWAMMIGGIGVVGGAMRRRRVNTKVSFA